MDDFRVAGRPPSWRRVCRPCLAAYQRARREADPRRARAEWAAWERRNKAKVRASARTYKARNAARRKRYNSDWWASHKDLAREYAQARRSRRVGAGGVVSAKWAAVLRGDPCSYCSKPGGTVDHVVALNDGGSNAESNVAGCCQSCNSSKRDRRLVAWLLGRP